MNCKAFLRYLPVIRALWAAPRNPSVSVPSVFCQHRRALPSISAYALWLVPSLAVFNGLGKLPRLAYQRKSLSAQIPIQLSSGADASSERLPHIVEALAGMACRLFRRHSIHLLGMALRLLIIDNPCFLP